MKVLFLDVDGVLNLACSGSMKTLNKKRVRFLQQIVEETDCKIVLSSTWRLDSNYYYRLSRTLDYKGMKIYGLTPDLKNLNMTRGDEIQQWLTEHKDDNIAKYAIVDDNDWMLDHQQPYFVKTDPKHGLTEETTQQLIDLLS